MNSVEEPWPTCGWCDGTGTITAYGPWAVWTIECPRCKGAGKLTKQLTNFFYGVGWSDEINGGSGRVAWLNCVDCGDETPHISFRPKDDAGSIIGEDVCDECGHSRLIYR